MMTSAPVLPAPEIEEIRLDKERRCLTLAFAGRRAELAAPDLRAACRCAACLAERATGRFPARFEGVTLEGVAPFGAHALNLSFSDGHARGVYPFAYLAALAAERADTDLSEITP